MKNDIFWSEMWLGFGEPAGTPPPRNPRGTLPEDRHGAALLRCRNHSEITLLMGDQKTRAELFEGRLALTQG